MSKLGDLPEGVASAMFLRDGWPHAVVCKVVMTDGCVGVGIYRHPGGLASPEAHDQMAMLDALQHVAGEPPDYSPLHEHVAKMRALADGGVEDREQAFHDENVGGESLQHDEEETDEDLQASLGQKAHD